MSSFPQSSPANPQPSTAAKCNTRSLVWRDCRTVAGLLGISEGQTRRKCLTEWNQRGVAEQRDPGDGRKSIWFVREDADPGLARVKSVEQLNAEFDLNRLTKLQRDAILFK